VTGVSVSACVTRLVRRTATVPVRAMISAGVVKGFNDKAKLTTRKAYGFRNPQGIEFAMFHLMGHRARAGMYPQILRRRLFSNLF